MSIQPVFDRKIKLETIVDTSGPLSIEYIDLDCFRNYGKAEVEKVQNADMDIKEIVIFADITGEAGHFQKVLPAVTYYGKNEYVYFILKLIDSTYKGCKLNISTATLEAYTPTEEDKKIFNV